jgi:predicted RNase H-like HicB family nuclease
MQLPIKIANRNHEGWQAWCPPLPGCWVRGASRQEVQSKIHSAVAGYLASMEVALPRELARRFRGEGAPATSA